jgi:transcriptional regulator with XRE-family HTH domain
MPKLTDALLDAIKDYSDEQSLKGTKQAKAFGVNHGTLSRWFAGRVETIRDRHVGGIAERLGLTTETLNKVIPIDEDLKARLADALRTRGITAGNWPPDWDPPLGVSFGTVQRWIGGKSKTMRYDVYERLCGALGWEVSDRRPVRPNDLPSGPSGTASRGRNDLLAEATADLGWGELADDDEAIVQVPATMLTSIVVLSRSDYEELRREMRPADFSGTMRLYRVGTGKGQLRAAIVNGARTKVVTGHRQMGGRLYFVPIFVPGKEHEETVVPSPTPPATT